MSELYLIIVCFITCVIAIYLTHRENKRFEKEIDEMWKTVRKEERQEK